MRNRATATLVLAIAAFIASPAAAQGQGFGFLGGLGGFSLLQLTPPLEMKLALTDEQKTKLATARDAMRQQTREAFQGGQDADRQAALQKLQAIRQKAEADAAALLTAEQKPKYEAMKKMSEEYQGLGRHSVGLLGVDGLTDDQKSKLKALAADIGAKRRELFQGGNFQEALPKIRELDMQTATAVGNILTADQLKQHNATMPQMRRPGGQN
jgi:hypothetical protein